jgi:hypothetical protein
MMRAHSAAASSVSTEEEIIPAFPAFSEAATLS